MEICPICNGLEDICQSCPQCGRPMEERGPLQDFIDGYSPYLSQEMGEGLAPPGTCVHLYYCRACDRDQRLAIPRRQV